MQYNILSGAVWEVDTTEGNKNLDFNTMYNLSEYEEPPAASLEDSDILVITFDLGRRIHLDRFEYKYSIDKCDIVDKKSGEAYRQCRLKWINWVSGEDSHSISRQIYYMVRDYALFCVVNELRRIAVMEPEEGVSFNGYPS